MKQLKIWPVLFLFCLAACLPDNNKDILFEHPGYEFPYRFDKPGQSWKLPPSLVEISGLGFIDAHRLACVQDENGIIYIFNLKAGSVENEIIFGDDGDYEGIEVIEDDAWVLKSNGTLYQVEGFLKNAEYRVNKYKTPLSRKNNAEGLAYDPVSQRLLIACKGLPFIDKQQDKEFKAIYRFDLDSKQMDPDPFLLISLDTLKAYQDYSAMTRWGMDVMAYFNPSGGDQTFAPSGIAIHPLTGDIYILGSVGKLLLVFSREGEMLAMVRLNPEIFRKPEGICFSPDGTLYIASEGKGREGAILKFGPTFNS